ncbi:MAG: carboxynorspermidine decarboxylase [Tannerellaceae bacterium]|nr:carboxynorspermidine decarboxylase [Tannerellaceae bacterium]
MLETNQIPSPCYVLEEKKLRNNLALIKQIAHTAEVEILPALKAFSLWKVFPLLRQYIGGASVSSPWEARLAAEALQTPVHVCSPGYTGEDIKELLPAMSHITFNSLSQYERFHPLIAASSGKNISCGLRINPGYSPVTTDLYNPTVKGSRLGVSYEQLPEKLPEGIEGLHFHVLCESTSYDLERALSVVENRFAPHLTHIKWLNMGGGHLMTDKDYDVKHLIHLLRTFKSRYPHLQVILEPGSALVWQAGFLRTTVVDIVNNSGIATAILDVSFTCHMPDCLEMPYRPVIRGALEMHPDIILSNGYRMGGNSCLAGDFIRDPYYFNQPLHPGDSLIFEDMAHYTTVKTTFFNGLRHPAMALLNNDGELELLRKFTFDDYRNRMC